MNNCILMAEIVQEPQLRYTAENQMPIAEFIVQFTSVRPEEPPSQLKVVGWGNLAQEIQERYHQGDRVIVEGRLGMNTIDRPEGFKEKRAELTVQKIHLLGATGETIATSSSVAPSTSGTTSPRTGTPAASPAPQAAPTRTVAEPKAKAPQTAPPRPVAEPDLDEIPF